MAGADTIRSGKTTVSTAGTAVALSSASILATFVTIKALAGQSDNIYVGNDGADDVTSSNGFVLDANEEVTLWAADLSEIIIDAGDDNQSVTWVASVSGTV